MMDTVILIRVCGMIGIVASLVMIVADTIFLGQSDLITGLLVYFIGMAPGAHVYYANNGIIQGVRKKLPEDSPEVKVLDTVSLDQQRIFLGMGIIILAVYLLGSIALSILLLTGKTSLPVWTAAINPFILTAAAYTSSHWAPPAISGFLSPVSVYVGVLPMQILILVQMWNG
jgi:hypothetical protein